MQRRTCPFSVIAKLIFARTGLAACIIIDVDFKQGNGWRQRDRSCRVILTTGGDSGLPKTLRARAKGLSQNILTAVWGV